MAANVKSLGLNFSPVSVGANAANSQVKNSAANNQAPVDNMSMRGNANQNVTLNAEVKAYIVETKRDSEAKLQRAPNLDIQSGKQLV